MAELSTLARPYAKAAFEYALESNQLQAWSKMLTLTAAVSEQDKVAELLASPEATSSELADTFVNLCGDQLDQKAANFIGELAQHKRLSLLPQINEQFEALKALQQQVVDVEVSSAFELDDSQVQTLAGKLKVSLNREVQMHTQVDKNLLGGVLIRAGDLVIDGSVRGKLAKLAEVMNQ
jgi:F-type H+-transporting ATPase subunit delta